MEATRYCYKPHAILFLSLSLTQSLAYTIIPRHDTLFLLSEQTIRSNARRAQQDRNAIFLSSTSILRGSKSSLSITEYDDFLPTPHPDLDAPGVVQTCMTALLDGKENAGLDVCFSFSSDRCRVRRSKGRPLGYGPHFAISTVRSPPFVLSPRHRLHSVVLWNDFGCTPAIRSSGTWSIVTSGRHCPSAP